MKKILSIVCAGLLVCAPHLSGIDDAGTAVVKGACKALAMVWLEALSMFGQYHVARTFFNNSTAGGFAAGCAAFAGVAAASSCVKTLIGCGLGKRNSPMDGDFFKVSLSSHCYSFFSHFLGMASLPVSGFASVYALDTKNNLPLCAGHFALGVALTYVGKMSFYGVNSQFS